MQWNDITVRETKDYFAVLAAVNIIFIPLGMVFYGEPYRFWIFAISDLGMFRTPAGEKNYLSFAFFAVNMIICSLVFAAYARSLAYSPWVRRWRTKRLCASLASVGFLFAILPHNLYHVIHLISCGVAIGSLWFLGNLFSLELFERGRAFGGSAVQIVLQSTILPYAFAFFSDAGSKQAFQKLAFFGMIIALSLVTRLLREQLGTPSTAVSKALLLLETGRDKSHL